MRLGGRDMAGRQACSAVADRMPDDSPKLSLSSAVILLANYPAPSADNKLREQTVGGKKDREGTTAA